MTADLHIRSAVEDFLYEEAWLLDNQRYGEWFDLCTDDVVYWVPAGGKGIDPEEEISLIYDNRARLDRRIRRFTGDWVLAQDPRTEMSRTVANVQLAAGEGWVPPNASAGDVVVRSRCDVAEMRRHQAVRWTGLWEYRLRRVPAAETAAFTIAFKKVTLVNRDEELPALAFIL